MNASRYSTLRLALYPILLLAWIAQGAGAFPVDDAFPRAHDQAKPTLHDHPSMKVPDSEYPSMNPDRSGEINEPHPIPDALKQESDQGRPPGFYYELLRVEPVNQVQSKTFDVDGFRAVRRIGVTVFENKIPDPIRDKMVGNLLANQFSQELQAVRRDRVLSPSQLQEDVQLRMEAQPDSGRAKAEPSPEPEAGSPAPGMDLSLARDKVDAVIVGAVSRFTQKYRNRRGELVDSMGATVEFTAFLVSTKTGRTLWGARFVGTQKPSIMNAFNGRYRWLNKDELSRLAIRQIVQDFQQIRKTP